MAVDGYLGCGGTSSGVVVVSIGRGRVTVWEVFQGRGAACVGMAGGWCGDVGGHGGYS